jgi:hypothetical protein
VHAGDLLSDLPAGVLDHVVTLLQKDGAAGCAGLRATSKGMQSTCDGATRSLVLSAPKGKLAPQRGQRPHKRQWLLPLTSLQSKCTALVARTPQLTDLELRCQLPSDAAWQRIVLTVAPRLQRLVMPGYSVRGLGVLSVRERERERERGCACLCMRVRACLEYGEACVIGGLRAC